MVQSLKRKGTAASLRADVYDFVSVPKPKRGELPNVRTLLQEVSALSVDVFMNETTTSFFEIMQLPNGFITASPPEWEAHADFVRCHELLRGLNVTNEIAERAMGRMTTFQGSTVASIEQRKQEVLRVVDFETKNHRGCSRKELDSCIYE